MTEGIAIIAEVASSQIAQLAQTESTTLATLETTPSTSGEDAYPELEPPTPEQAAIAWIDHLQKGGSVPDAKTLIGLLQAMVVSRAPPPTPAPTPGVPTDPNVTLKIVDTSPKFPHMLDTANGTLSANDVIWTQCKTKMTHIAVRLVDSNDRPVAGSSLQLGGLALRLTLHKMSDLETPLTDDDNPRPSEGLFRGRAGSVFESRVNLAESRHEFRFQVMLLSSDIGGAKMFVKVAPTNPHLALNPNLIARSHTFISRARMPDESYMGRGEREKRSNAASQLQHMAETKATRAVVAEPNKRQCSPERTGPTETDTTPVCVVRVE